MVFWCLEKKKALWTWSFLGLLKAFLHICFYLRTLSKCILLSPQQLWVHFPLLQSWWNLSEAKKKMIPSRPLNTATNGWSWKRKLCLVVQRAATGRHWFRATCTAQAPCAHSLAMRPPSYRRGYGTRRSRTIQLGYRARQDSDLVYLQFSMSWLAAASSMGKALSRDLGTWNKDLDCTFCRTFGFWPRRKQKFNLLAFRIFSIPVLR